MGRFDALTQIEEKPQKKVPPRVDSSPTASVKQAQNTAKSTAPTVPTRLPIEIKRQETLTDVLTSLLHDVNLRAWKETIENTETRGSTLRLTNEEDYAVEDVIKELERKLKVKTSLNELARLGLLFLVHDFKTRR